MRGNKRTLHNINEAVTSKANFLSEKMSTCLTLGFQRRSDPAKEVLGSSSYAYLGLITVKIYIRNESQCARDSQINTFHTNLNKIYSAKPESHCSAISIIKHTHDYYYG